MGANNRRQFRIWHFRQVHRNRRFLAQLRPFNRHKRWTEPADTREILVTRRLINRPLTAQFRLDRHDRNAVRLHPAIAATLTNICIDKHPLIRIWKLTALATPPLFGRTSLNINNGRYTADFTHLFLNTRHFGTLKPLDSRRKHLKVDFFFVIINKPTVFTPIASNS